MRALHRLPRDKAIDGILAFNKMRCVPTFTSPLSFFTLLDGKCSDNLVEYLRPFAQEGQIVKEADVRSFFETMTESARQRQR
jgi:E3 ubiquitin-protein ligase UBR7